MKEIIISEEKKETILFKNVSERTPIFAKRNVKLCGMIVKESRGWVLRTGGGGAATGHYKKLLECIESCIPYGYTFFVNRA